MTFKQQYASPLGDITLISDGESLTGLWFTEQRSFPAAQDLTDKSLPVFEQAAQWLDIYFGGATPDFTPPLQMEGTPFRKTVWEFLLAIPYGTTVTYGEIAAQLINKTGCARMSAQAVGGAVGHNPISLIVPCHRVVGANGRIVGYGGGIDKKVKLLSLEGVDPSLYSRP